MLLCDSAVLPSVLLCLGFCLPGNRFYDTVIDTDEIAYGEDKESDERRLNVKFSN